MKKWFRFDAAAEGDAEIFIYDYIGKCWWSDSDPDDPTMSSTKFIRLLGELGGRHVNLRVNSLGGDPFESHAIANAIARHPGGVTAYIDSIAASAASEVVCACDEVVCAANGMLMIHKASTMEWGNADEMRATAAILDKLDLSLCATYATKTGKTATECLALMAGEVDGTWFTAEEALAAGLVDRIGNDVEVPVQEPTDFAAAGIRLVPARFAAMLGLPGEYRADGRRNSSDDEALLIQARDNIDTVLGNCPDESGDAGDQGSGAEDSITIAASGDAPRTVGHEIAALLTSRSAE
jgi:ATP-dependent protease ClpP protease subunit